MDHDKQHEGSKKPPPINQLLPPPTHDASDPEEQNLDDLDDMLDDFSVSKSDVAQNDPQNPFQEVGHKILGSDDTTKEFDKRLEDQIAALMGTLDGSSNMKEEIGAMIEDIDATASTGTAANKDTSGLDATTSYEPPLNTDEHFQDLIRKTMERMRASEENSTSEVPNEGADVLAELMKGLQNGEPEASSDDDGFNKVLMGMMEQLTNKEILYEPMKELHDKFPEWMIRNKADTDDGDMRRYGRQQTIVAEIVERFEKNSYSDANAADREFIVERMQQMQTAGNPPIDLIGDMGILQEPTGDMDSGCPQQ